MTTITVETAPAETVTETEGADVAPAVGELVADELLVEEISIDGMCGVY